MTLAVFRICQLCLRSFRHSPYTRRNISRIGPLHHGDSDYCLYNCFARVSWAPSYTISLHLFHAKLTRFLQCSGIPALAHMSAPISLKVLTFGSLYSPTLTSCSSSVYGGRYLVFLNPTPTPFLYVKSHQMYNCSSTPPDIFTRPSRPHYVWWSLPCILSYVINDRSRG